MVTVRNARIHLVPNFKKTGKTISKKTKDSEWADILDMIKNDSSLKRGEKND